MRENATSENQSSVGGILDRGQPTSYPKPRHTFKPGAKNGQSKKRLGTLFYTGSLEEMEITIRIDRMDGMAHICSTWPAWSRKLERRCGPPKRYTERDGKVTSAFWEIPARLITVRRDIPRKSKA